ncbi:MAG: amino acid adenylation domain-containing protein, partial [Candidatus Binatia bacterium]
MINNRSLEPLQVRRNRSAQDRLGDPQALANLTTLQSEFWIGQRLYPDAPLFNCVDTFTIRGPIEPDHFQAAFQALIDKTDALRTIFEEIDGIPRQRVVDEIDYAIEYLDFSQESTPCASFEDWMQQRSRVPIDIEKRSFDSALAKISEDQFIWYLSLHHIASDGWTFYLIFHRMEALYRRSLEGRLDEPITFPLFRDYIEAERAYRVSPQYLADKAYWEKRPTETQPLTFYGRNAAKRPASVRKVNYEVAPERTQRLKTLAQQEQFAGNTLNVALFNMLAGVFTAYLCKISGNDYFCIGTPFSNRPSPVLKQTAGLLMEVAPLRITIEKGDTFTSLVRRLQLESAETARHRRYPLRNHQNSLCDVIFNFRSGFLTAFHGMPVQENVIHSGTDRYSFSLHVRYPETECVLLQFDFHPDVFDEAQQTRAIEHFLHTLDAFLQNPDQRIDRIGLLSAAEKRRVVEEFNATSVDFPEDACIHRIFEAQVERSPDALAVDFPPPSTGDPKREQLTYGELNREANRLAHHLRSLGVGPEVLVGICMERSVDMIIGLLAILKAGGAYVPLDPSYPQERLGCMLEDAGLSVLVTHERLTECLPSYGARVICLDSDRPAIARQSDRNPASGVMAENLAYVIFTSGSTGRPKGAMNTHRGIRNRLLWMQQAYHLQATDRVLQKTPVSFDVSVWEFFWPLMTGACLVVALPGGHKDSAYLAQVIADQKITTIHFVPSMLEAFLHESNSLGACGSLKRVICSGEALTPELQDKFFACLGAELHNLYGPTEAAVDVTSWACSRESNLRSIPIGKPIANTQIHILDSFLQPVPIGVTGELHIGGIGLARGYANRADLTAEKFIPNPFSDNRGERLYKTGDLARYRHDGSIEFLGRIDHQVKIRGFRVELGEIETVLRQHPAIRETVVVAREDSTADDETQNLKSGKRLVAYIVARPEEVLRIGELRSLLKQKLPEYMVPSAFVLLDALRVGPNGKIDRRALPAVDSVRADLEVPYVAPRTDTEKVLAAIWTGVFKLDRVGIHDNFFDLGGHSLTAVQVASRIRDAFQIDLSLRTIFEKPTITGLAEHVEAASPKKHEIEFTASISVPRFVTRPLSFAQQRLWFLDQLEPGTPLYNIAEAFRLRGPINVAAMERSVNEIVQRHEALRTTFSTVGGTGAQVISPSLRLTMPVLDLADGPENNHEDEARRLAREEAERPFDLFRGPLLRANLLRLGHEDHVLLITMHHIVSDGWSMAIFLREVTALYNVFSKDEPSPFTELALQYSDYAEWQHRWLREEALETQVGYWKNQLAGVATLQLRTDRPRPAIQSFRGDQQIIVLPEALTRALKTLSQEQHVTPFMVLLAAFKALLHRYSGQRDIAVGVPIAGRNRFEFEHLIGFFVNTLVLRTELAGECTFRELVTRMRDVCLSAYDNQDLPFEKLVEELKPDRDLSRNPLFQVLFQVRNLPKETLQFSEVASDEFPFDRKIARFDLTLDITEIAGELRCTFGYNTDLFDASTIVRMQQHYQHLLENVVAQPDRSIGEIALLTEAEKRQLLVDRDDTDESALKDQCIHRLFEEQAARTANAIAVVFEDQELTYRELNRRANQLAHYLRNHGVGPEVLVGLYVERSAEMIVGLLATMKSGGAYLPLDPEYPQERLDFIIEDALPRVVLTHQRLAHRLSKHRAVIIALDIDWEDVAQESDRDLLSHPTGDGLAYVIYTSGSTGEPKGVMVEHGQAVSYCSGAIQRLHPATGSSFAMVQPLMFDSSLTVIFVSLLTGGSLHVISKQRALDPHALGDYFQTRPIDFLKITPSHLASLQAASVPPGRVMPRRCLILGGEESRREWIESLQCLAPDCTIFNHYGPTETTVGVLMYRMREEEGAPVVSKTPLGRPLAGTQVYLLDRNLEPVPAGVSGELYIGGLNLTRGYLN